jgi:hypothetical protein
MNKKMLTFLLLALFLLVALFGMSVWLGAREPGSMPKFNPQSTSMVSLAGFLSRPAKAEDLTLRSDSAAGCSFENGQITIQPGNKCVFSVSSDKTWTRKLRLKLLPLPEGQPGNVSVTLEQPEALTIEQELEPSKTSDPFDIYGRQDQAVATLSIQAPAATVPESPAYVIEVVEK